LSNRRRYAPSLTDYRYSLPEAALPYRKVVADTVRKVQVKVTGASRLSPEALAQEAWAIVSRLHLGWEARARDLDAYARSRLFGELANSAREILRTQGYGKTDYHWGAVRPPLDPGSRGLRSDLYRGDLEDPRPNPEAQTSRKLDDDPRYQARLSRRGLAPEDQDQDDSDRIPGIYGRSAHWARTFRHNFPYAAEAFLALDDRQRVASLSVPEFTRRQEAARVRLRARYAREIEITDEIEATREDGRLLRAMFGATA
jgi:hypothetical protein